jgi:hypothetical protein
MEYRWCADNIFVAWTEKHVGPVPLLDEVDPDRATAGAMF